MSVAADPVQNPHAYQKMLIDLVGNEDPAGVQAATSASLRHLIDDADDLLRTRPAQREWSVIEVLGHMLDAEIISSARYRWVIAENQPPLIGYDQDLWVDALGYNQSDPVSCSQRSMRCAPPTWRSGAGQAASSVRATGCTRNVGRRASTSCSG